MENLNLYPLSSDRNDNYRTFCPKRTKHKFPNVSLLLCFPLFSFFLSVGCASLLPSEQRVYPNNPVTLPEGMDIHKWMESKKKQYQERIWFRQFSESEYKFSYYRKNHTSLGSYISCTSMVRSKTVKLVEFYNLISIVNYADYTKGMRKGGDLGPMNEKEKTEILFPCIEEFLELPLTKE